MNLFKRIFYSFRLKKAIQLADDSHANDGERYYVIPSTEKGIKLIVLNRRNFRILKSKGYISRKASVMNLDSESFYATPYRDGSRTPSQFELDLRRQAYLFWVEQKLKADKPKPKTATEEKSGKEVDFPTKAEEAAEQQE